MKIFLRSFMIGTIAGGYAILISMIIFRSFFDSLIPNKYHFLFGEIMTVMGMVMGTIVVFLLSKTKAQKMNEPIKKTVVWPIMIVLWVILMLPVLLVFIPIDPI